MNRRAYFSNGFICSYMSNVTEIMCHCKWIFTIKSVQLYHTEQCNTLVPICCAPMLDTRFSDSCLDPSMANQLKNIDQPLPGNNKRPENNNNMLQSYIWPYGIWNGNGISRVSCQKGPTRHAYAWQIGPFWQDTLVMEHGQVITILLIV